MKIKKWPLPKSKTLELVLDRIGLGNSNLISLLSKLFTLVVQSVWILYGSDDKPLSY